MQTQWYQPVILLVSSIAMAGHCRAESRDDITGLMHMTSVIEDSVPLTDTELYVET